jgi:hypothetical protein
MKKVNVNLVGPFSPFATALRNIRDNLISKQKPISLKDLQEEFLITTVTLTIADPTYPESFLEFPSAACWLSKRPKTIKLHYSGEYANVLAISEAEEREKISTIPNNILKRVRKIIESEETEGRFEGFPFEGEPTDYPESLRHIEGYWLFKIESKNSELSFLVFWSHQSRDIKNRGNFLGAENGSTKGIKELLKAFFSEGIEELEILIDEGRPPLTMSSSNTVLSYPVLRDILSNLIAEIDYLGIGKTFSPESSDINSDETNLRDVFRIVFVRPTIMHTGQLGFRYILTQQQISYLDRQTIEGLDKCIEQRETSIYEQLSNEFESIKESLGRSFEPTQSQIGQTIRIEKNDDLVSLIIFLSNEKLYLKHGIIEELLRKAIYVYYAFCKTSKDDLKMRIGNLVDELEGGAGDVTSEQAFLITQIFASRRPHIVSNFINHPFSKYLQHSTEELIEIFSSKFNEGRFYPPFLHLFETLVLPERLFMYPIFQYDSPLLLSACDAYYYAPIQTNFKSILDRNAQGIFNSILGFELAQTNYLMTEEVKEAQSGEELLENALSELIKARLRHLTLHFCHNPMDIETTRIKETRLTGNSLTAELQLDRKSAKIVIPELYKEITIKHTRGKKIITASPDGMNAFRLYLSIIISIFSRFFEIRELIESKAKIEGALKQRQDQYIIQAHEIKKVTNSIAGETPAHVLDQIRVYFNTLFGITVDALFEQGAAAFPSDYAAGDSLFEFVRNAMRVAARIGVIISWTSSGNTQRDESELAKAAENDVDRLEIFFDNLKITAGVDKNKWSFFAALVCGLRNVLKHSPSNSKIKILRRDRTGLIVILNEATWFMRGDGQMKREKFSPGQTQEALDFYVNLYDNKTRDAVMHWNHFIKCYVTKIPYPKIILGMNK